MPFTPYHFGPGLLFKSLLPRHFSFLTFVSTNVVIDVETLYFLVTRQYPVHRFLHTFVGATFAGLAVAGLMIAIVRWLRRTDIARLWEDSPEWIRSEVSTAGVLVGGLVGGISHAFLDGIMHRDAQPFSPFTSSNPLLGAIDVTTLHFACISSAGLAIAVAVVRRLVARRAT